jgi:hypothetical protein
MLSQVSLGSVEDRNEIGNQPWRRFRTCPHTARDPKKFPEGLAEGRDRIQFFVRMSDDAALAA